MKIRHILIPALAALLMSAAPLAVSSCSGPVEPDNSEVVEEPEEPDQPDTPGEPDKPDTPDQPDTPEQPDTPDQPDQPGEPDKPEEPQPTTGKVELDKLYGYAEGVTGGKGGKSLHFNNGKALQTWLTARTKTEKAGDHTPTVIYLSGSFGPTDGRDFSEAHPWFDVKEVSNLSFLGVGGFTMDQIGFFVVRAKNIVIRNIYFKMPKANNGADAVSMQGVDGVWVDHCTFESLNQSHDYEDGSCDVTHASKNVTVSWNKFIKTQKSCLVGHSSSATDDVAIRATFHHNWFNGSSSRHPRVRYGRVHVYNNFYDNNTTYGVGSAMGAMVLVQANLFDGLALPTDIATYPAKKDGSSWVSNLTDKTAGYLFATEDNVYENKVVKESVCSDPYPMTNVQYTVYGGTPNATAFTYSDFAPTYEFVLDPVADLRAIVTSGAGSGILPGFAEAPIPVDNAGITDFDGSGEGNPDDSGSGDDNPGGEGGGDNPGQPVGGEGTYTHDFTKDGFGSDSFFTISGNTKTGLSVTIGGVTYTQGLKMESSAGEVKFNAAKAGTLTMYLTSTTGKIKVDGTAYAATDYIVTVPLAAGSHSVTKGDALQLLLIRYVEQ